LARTKELKKGKTLPFGLLAESATCELKAEDSSAFFGASRHHQLFFDMLES
jgi:hypothetical protein